MEGNKQQYRHDITNKGASKRSATGLMPILLVILILLLQCKQPYNSPYISPKTGYLVIEGYISGNTTTSFRLTRTIKLSSDTTNPQEPGASMQVEGTDNSIYPLTDQGAGVYGTAGALSLNTSVKYRLRIKTQSGEDYLSDYVPYKITPVIDSINWVQNSDGVTIYASAHDDTRDTRYYQWNYDETWEYHAALQSNFIYVASDTSVVRRTDQQQTYRCWQGGSPSRILIASTAKLSTDVVYEYPIKAFLPNSSELGVLYSALIRQYALTDSGYNYLSLMEKNTESLGTIFDPQPTQLYGGNIHSLSNANEPVIGYVSAGTIQQQRIFIYEAQLKNWDFSVNCGRENSLFPATKVSFLKYFGRGPYVPLDSLGGAYSANIQSCTDCTILGGATRKPSFWPN